MDLGIKHLKAVGLTVEESEGTPGERRITVRLGSLKGPFVAWFQSGTRMADGVPVLGVNTQFARLPGLREEQVAAVEHFLASNHLRMISAK